MMSAEWTKDKMAKKKWSKEKKKRVSEYFIIVIWCLCVWSTCTTCICLLNVWKRNKNAKSIQLQTINRNESQWTVERTRLPFQSLHRHYISI